jgi:hypothetical protein
VAAGCEARYVQSFSTCEQKKEKKKHKKTYGGKVKNQLKDAEESKHVFFNRKPLKR